MSSLRFIAVDLNGSRIDAARYTVDGVQEARVSLSLGNYKDVDRVFRYLRSAVQQVWLPVASGASFSNQDIQVAALGVSVPGLVNPLRGVVHSIPCFPTWSEVPLRDMFLESFGIPVFIGNAFGLAALAEGRFGAARGVSDMIYISMDEHIRGGMVFNSHLYTGVSGMGGEIGHMLVSADGIPCYCGNVGCLETVASGAAIVQRVKARLQAGEASELLSVVDDVVEHITLDLVLESAMRQDVVGCEALALAARSLGQVLVSLMYLLNPDLFVIGGMLATAGPALFEPLRETVSDCAVKPIARRARIVSAMLNSEEAYLWGALALSLMELDL